MMHWPGSTNEWGELQDCLEGSEHLIITLKKRQ